jgi:hypothetical protein
MNNFVLKYRQKIKGVLTGFDRLVFKGLISKLNYTKGMAAFLFSKNVLLKNFETYVEKQTNLFRKYNYEYIEKTKRPYQYLNSSTLRKDEIAKGILENDKITDGLICSLGTVEPCMSYKIFKNKDNCKLELEKIQRKCLHYYHYYDHPTFGLMSIRLQSWFPFDIQICINGREFLKKQLDKKKMGYKKLENCFIDIDDIDLANNFMQKQLSLNYPCIFNDLIYSVNPFFKDNLSGQSYYWTIHQSEWATDVIFKDSIELQKIYPRLVQGAMCCFSSNDVMRFLGKKLHGNYKGEVITDFKNRPEGIRIKHILGPNSIKMYDKKAIILRIETTVNNPYIFKVYRKSQNSVNDEYDWKPMRKNVADIKRRSDVCNASNNHYLDSLSSLDTNQPLNKLVDDICKPTKLNNKRVRALRPWDSEDMLLLKSINHGEHAINGFRNRDLRPYLYPENILNDDNYKKKISSATSRKLRLLRAHGIISKVNKTHRYVVTDKGKKVISAILQYQNITLEQLNKLAA